MPSEELLLVKRVDGPRDGEDASLAPPTDRVCRQIVFIRRHDGEAEKVPEIDEKMTM